MDNCLIEGSLEVKLLTIWTDEKQRWEESEKRRKERRSEKRKSQKTEDAGARKGSKVAKHCVFQMVRGSGGTIRKVGSLKRRVRSHVVRWEMKSCTPLWREAHFQVKMLKAPHARTTFEGSDVVSPFRRKGFCTLPNVSKTWRFCSISKNDGRRGTFEEDLQRYISRGRRNTRDMFVRDVRRSGRWFLQKGCILEHQIFSFGKVILRGRCSTLDRWSGKIAKRIGTRPSALHSTFYFWRKSRRTASFLMLLVRKIEDVSQQSFVFKLADRQMDR